jgi:hypothetical protein
MPVRKFRSIGEMEDALWHWPDDPLLITTIAELWEFSEVVCPRRFPPGVYRHRSIGEAQQLREEWEAASFEAFHARQAALRGAAS